MRILIPFPAQLQELTELQITLSGDANATWIVKKSGDSYAFTVATGGTYTVTPSKSGYTFTPSDKTIKNLSANLTQNFDAKPITYTLSGTITGADSVLVTLSGGSSATWMVIKSGGSYSFTVAAFGTYTIMPTKKGYIFTPNNKTVENLVANQVQNFDAKPLFILSGTVTGADGVTVTLSGDATGSQTVNNGGSYSFMVAYGGNYTVTPSKVAYDFTPPNKTFTNVSVGEMQDFITKFNYESLGIFMKPIPAGTFTMGQTGIAEPIHTVTLSVFEMSATEITQRQFKALIGTNPSSDSYSYFGEGDNYPVYNVIFFDAIKFCNALSVKSGFMPCYDETTGACDFTKNGFRLPTEAEWEYACRGGSKTVYNLGDTESDLDRAGWYQGNSEWVTHPVGLKIPNAWGLFDMHGNVEEWCNDWYGNYSSASATNPSGLLTGSYRVIRGGGWTELPVYCPSAYRGRVTPTNTILNIGFRVVRRP